MNEEVRRLIQAALTRLEGVACFADEAREADLLASLGELREALAVLDGAPTGRAAGG